MRSISILFAAATGLAVARRSAVRCRCPMLEAYASSQF